MARTGEIISPAGGEMMYRSSQSSVSKYRRWGGPNLDTLGSSAGTPVADWRYCGGSSSQKSRDFYRMCFPREKLIPYGCGFCVCGKKLVSRYCIANIVTDRVFVVGDCCVHHFLPKSRSERICPVCFSFHEAKEDPWCEYCRAGTVSAGPYRGHSYECVYHTQAKYCDFYRSKAAKCDPQIFATIPDMALFGIRGSKKYGIPPDVPFIEWLLLQPSRVTELTGIVGTNISVTVKKAAGRKYRQMEFAGQGDEES